MGLAMIVQASTLDPIRSGSQLHWEFAGHDFQQHPRSEIQEPILSQHLSALPNEVP
jgi:hypothetical protein